MDQIFSRISLALSKHPAMTFMELARIVHDSFSPSNNVHQLERTWNVHPWLIGDGDCPVIATFWGDISDGQQFLIERCSHDMSGKPISTGVSLQSIALDLMGQKCTRFRISLRGDLNTMPLVPFSLDGKKTPAVETLEIGHQLSWQWPNLTNLGQ